MADWEPLGLVALIQLQREPLKATGVYDPSPLLVVERATVSPGGLLGWHGSAWVVDAHHSAHPRSRGGGRRALSVGFTGHYRRMEEHFGSAPIGIAGENVIVDAGPVRHGAIAGGLLVRPADRPAFVLRAPRVASPCVEFTSYLLGSADVLPLDDIRADIDFLDQGTRGFIVSLDHVERHYELRVGDEVLVQGGP